MTKFEIGKQYSMRSIGDHNCVWTYTVTARTTATITLQDDRGKVTKCRISKKLSAYDDRETVQPLGNYSMCPLLRA